MPEFKSPPIRAKESDLKLWSGVSSKARYDYDATDYLLDEMLNNDFFGYCTSLLRKGDQITITDAEDQIVIVRVDDVLKPERQVWLSTLERKHAYPVVVIKHESDPGLVYRWRTTRGGGHAIVTRTGLVAGINFGSREEALRVIDDMYRENTFIPPYGHDPAGVVKEALVFRPQVPSSVRSNPNSQHGDEPSRRQSD